MDDSETSPVSNPSFYARGESRLLELLPGFITPLRFRILVGYLVVLVLAIYGWEQIAAAWRYLLTLLAPAFALLGALLALKLGVVVVSLFTLMVALLKFFFGFLMVVLKPGIVKAILIPQLLSLATWFHRKSARLQNIFRRVYERFKAIADRLLTWWRAQHKVDKLLLSGFLVPLLVILLIVFIIERATAIFAIKKVTEQVVQKSTKFIIRNFHKVPVVGGIPASIANRTRKLTAKQDRADVVADLKSLGSELYHPEESDMPERSAGKTDTTLKH